MKRILLLAGAVALVLGSLSLASYRAQGPADAIPVPVIPPPASTDAPATPADNSNAQNWAKPSGDGPAAPAVTRKPGKPASIVDELVAILNETKSKETFTVTLTVLQKFGKEAKPAVPSILRNADRLGLFAGALAGDSKGKQASNDVLEAIDSILGKESDQLPSPDGCSLPPTKRRTPADAPPPAAGMGDVPEKE
jgi:hypothetical protein